MTTIEMLVESAMEGAISAFDYSISYAIENTELTEKEIDDLTNFYIVLKGGE